MLRDLLAAEGVKVVLNARNAAALDELADTLPDAVVVAGDITDPLLPGQLVDTALKRWGQVDIVVGNAGGPPTGSALDVDDKQILAAMNSNLLASVRLARAAVPHMREQRWGRVCFIASASVRQPNDFGQVVAFLCSEQARFINGIALGVDGGAVTGLL